MKLLTNTLLLLASFGLILPQASLVAAAEAHAAVASPNRGPIVTDVKLTQDGVLRGQFVSTTGAPKAGAQVAVSTANEVVATSTTGNQGEFAVQLNKGGVYQVSDGESSTLLRVWTHHSAPPAASQAVLIVSGDSTARAQHHDHAHLFGLALFAAAVTAVIITTEPDAS